jgi:hypothetical protein
MKPRQSSARSSAASSQSPQLTLEQVSSYLRPFGLDRKRHPLVFLGIRGYFADLGKPDVNDRSLYDDLCVISAPGRCHTFPANTDPDGERKGHGTGEAKGLASLKPGLYHAYKFDLHRGRYLALCQRAGNVTVVRDGDPPYLDTGMFGINIHQGGDTDTWSEGCQTVQYDSWQPFIDTAVELAKQYFGDRWQSEVYHYALVEARAQRSYGPLRT